MFFRGKLRVEGGNHVLGEVLILALKHTFSVTLGYAFYLSGPVSSSLKCLCLLRILPVLSRVSSEAVGKVEGTGDTDPFSCGQDLKISRELCPLPSPFSGQGSLAFPLAHLLSRLSLLF